MKKHRRDKIGEPKADGTALLVAEAGVFSKLLAVKKFHNEEGSDLVEYALLLGFVGLASVAILSTLSDSIAALWTSIANLLASTT